MVKDETYHYSREELKTGIKAGNIRIFEKHGIFSHKPEPRLVFGIAYLEFDRIADSRTVDLEEVKEISEFLEGWLKKWV